MKNIMFATGKLMKKRLFNKGVQPSINNTTSLINITENKIEDSKLIDESGFEPGQIRNQQLNDEF